MHAHCVFQTFIRYMYCCDFPSQHFVCGSIPWLWQGAEKLVCADRLNLIVVIRA
jgi:hypothetical protein